MEIEPAQDKGTKLIKGAIVAYAVLAGVVVTAAAVAQIWVLEQRPTLTGALVFCTGQLTLVQKLQATEPRRTYRLVVAAFLMASGAALQMLETFFPIP